MIKIKKISFLILALSLIIIFPGCSLYGPEETMDIDPPPATLELDESDIVFDTTNINTEQIIEEIPMAEDVQTIKQTIYFFDESGDVVPLTLDIPKVEGIGQEVLRYMTVGGPAEALLPEGFRPVLPEGTKFTMNIKFDEKLAIIDFSKEFFNYEASSPADEKKLLDAITWSITQFSTVDKVELRVNGYPIEAVPVWDTPVLNPLSRADGINLELGSNISIGNTTPVTLYFIRTIDNFEYLVPVTRLIPKTNDIAYATLEQLIAGPKPGSNLTSSILPTTKILSVKVSDNLLVADFDDEILGFDNQLSNELINMIIWSLSENTNIPTVQIKIMGKTNSLPDNFSKPIVKPEIINAAMF